MYFIRTPKIIQSIYKNYTWKINTNKKEIYLTFDDGPTPEITEFVLDILKKYNAKATFFCIGKNIEKYPDIFKRIVSESHSVGNHTQNHLNGWKTNNSDYLKSTSECDLVIKKSITNIKYQTPNTIFRPPYGKIKKSQAKVLLKKDVNIIMWTILSGDFDNNISKEKCLQNVIKNTKSGDIIVFHDSKKAFDRLKYTLPKVLSYFTKKGYTFNNL